MLLYPKLYQQLVIPKGGKTLIVSTDKISIVLIDDHKLFREGVKRILSIDSSCVVVAEGDDGNAALDIVSKHMPDIVLMDINMPDVDGVEATKLITEKFPSVKVIMLSIHEDEKLVTQALKNGAKGYLLKEIDTESLIEAIKIVHAGGSYLHPKITHHIVDYYRKTQESIGDSSNRLFMEYSKPLHILTKRECQVLQLLSEGRSNRDISELLLISEKTVKNHVSNILQKLEVTDRTQAVVMAIHNGWVKIDSESIN